jgi:hypothetical protein
MDHVFCIIMVHPLVSNKNKVRVMLTHTPALTVAVHNQRRTQNHETRAFAPYWRLVLTAGPFVPSERAVCYATDVVHGTRGVESKIDWAQQLAAQYGVTCRTDDCPLDPGDPALYLAAAGAPPTYLAALQVLLRAQLVLETYWNTSALPALLAEYEGFS